MFRRPHPVLLCLALCALAWAQVFGLTRGYVCDCGGTVEITSADHCHGPHGESCHDQEQAETHPHDEETAPAGSTEHHEPATITVIAKQQSQGCILAAPALTLITELPQWILTATTLSSGARNPARERDDGGGGVLRQWPQMLTHCIALRV